MLKLRTLATPFILAAGLSGCATIKFDADSCTTQELVTPIKIPFLLEFSTSSAPKYVLECTDGKDAARTTLFDQPRKGSLGPTGYLAGKNYIRNIENCIKNAPHEEVERCKARFTYFATFLKKDGGISPEQVIDPRGIIAKIKEEQEKQAPCVETARGRDCN
ncbi:MAG TPA: hypothetical protein PKI93_01885 [Alphaproteobacteria bacterium]|nr:hypothetical protein [Alphaproteobacteria bacterium]HNS44802.1 hypothetical protein [Alphaproteobacteria bacterium]